MVPNTFKDYSDWGVNQKVFMSSIQHFGIVFFYTTLKIGSQSTCKESDTYYRKTSSIINNVFIMVNVHRTRNYYG
ncbi:hypothetical protein WN55_08154 [Dufourea novaeangliae]|uniref:Uncharacterized protein n=1 Tax=Dufourea novaeangliae TaxID=178035 RepID=A0A154P4P2_DUFNO|nr:hypothetical protein WN55_08154 [Dufourea novaeangliae]